MYARIAMFSVLCCVLAGAQNPSRRPRLSPQSKAVATQAAAITSDPQHRLLLENPQVRVFRVELPPAKATALVKHDHDYLLVSLDDGTLEITPEKGQRQRVHVKPGELQLGKSGTADRVVNGGSTPLRYVIIEVLPGLEEAVASCGLGGPSCESELGELTGPRYAVGTMFETPTVIVRQTEMDPEANSGQHAHKNDHLVVAITDLELRSEVEDKGTSEIHHKAGDAFWIPGGFTHTLTNAGKQTARFLSVEFKGSR